MGTSSYWTAVFTPKTWDEFLKAKEKVSGHPEKKWKAVQKINPGDYLLAYLTGLSRFVGILEVVSPPYRENSQIWEDGIYPCRVKVKIVINLTPETAVSIHALKSQLKLFQNLKHPSGWTYPFLGSPYKLDNTDGEVIFNAITEANNIHVIPLITNNSVSLSFIQEETIPGKIGEITVKEPEEAKITPKEPTAHDEIQWLLLKLGNDMDLDVWVAKNDRNKGVEGHRFTDLQHLKDKLPVQFDEATNRTIELIDVLWIKGNAITAAFEIEHTTSIYSGLLRMSDLIAMHPNLNIPLYLVVPEERRNKVITEVNRPTFSRLSPPLSKIVRLITFPVLRERIKIIEPYISYLKLKFLDDLSESCIVEL